MPPEISLSGTPVIVEFGRYQLSGIITTVAGNGEYPFSGDGGPATSASIDVWGVAVDAAGNLFIAGPNNRRIRKVSTRGIITTIAGNGDYELGSNGDGGPASASELSVPFGLALDALGDLFIADGSGRVRKISVNGIITTVAGNGTQGSSGDDGLAVLASLNDPHGVAFDSTGDLFIAEYVGNRIRKVSALAMADVIENLVFTGRATCTDSFCQSFGSGPITGNYSLDVTAQAIVGAWSFSTPFGVISSSDPGARASVAVGSVLEPTFSVQTSTFLEFVKFDFPIWNLQQIGAVLEGPASDGCINIPGFMGTVACRADYRITGTTVLAGPSMASRGIVPVGSTINTIQPGEWVSIYGTNLASSTAIWSGNFPTSLGGTSVMINRKPGYLSYVSPTQINLQAPSDTTTGPVPVVVTTAGGTATATVTLAPIGPSFFLLDSKHVAGIIPRSNGSGAYGGGTYDILGPTGNSLGYPTVAAKAGDIIELFGTGFGPTIPAVPAGQTFSGAAPTTNPVNVLINNVSVTPVFAGLSGAGLYQINLMIPAGLGTADVSLAATVGGVRTPPTVVISLQ